MGDPGPSVMDCLPESHTGAGPGLWRHGQPFPCGFRSLLFSRQPTGGADRYMVVCLCVLHCLLSSLYWETLELVDPCRNSPRP